MKMSCDHSLFAWNRGSSVSLTHYLVKEEPCGFLARSPTDFTYAGDYIPFHSSTGREYTVTNRGLRIELPVCRAFEHTVALLQCVHKTDYSRSVGIMITDVGEASISRWNQERKAWIQKNEERINQSPESSDAVAIPELPVPELFDIRRLSPSSLVAIPLDFGQDDHASRLVRLYSPISDLRATTGLRRSVYDFLLDCSSFQRYTLTETIPSKHIDPNVTTVLLANDEGQPAGALFQSIGQDMPSFVIAVVQKNHVECQILTDKRLYASMDTKSLQSLSWQATSSYASTFLSNGVKVTASVKLRPRLGELFHIVDIKIEQTKTADRKTLYTFMRKAKDEQARTIYEAGSGALERLSGINPLWERF